MEPITRNDCAALASQLVDGAADMLPTNDFERLIALSHAASHAAIALAFIDAVSALENIE